MNELAQMISQKFNLSPEVSQQVVAFVLEQVKGKLPAGLSSQLDGLLGGTGTAEAADAGGLMDKVKSMAAGLMHSKE